MGENILILAFVVIVIGGIGSIRGALVGAVLVASSTRSAGPSCRSCSASSSSRASRAPPARRSPRC